MNFSDYQEETKRTMQTRNQQILTVSEMCLGLAGESGEVTDYLKKVYFHDHPLERNKLINELGDTLWYLTALCTIHQIDLERIAEANIQKLKGRYPNGFSRQDSIERKEK